MWFWLRRRPTDPRRYYPHPNNLPFDRYANAWTRHDAQAIAYRERFGL